MQEMSINICELLQAFSGSLAHKLRTPLSVISNELSCLELTGHGEELRTSRLKITEISEILKKATLTSRSFSASTGTLESLLNRLHNISVHTDLSDQAEMTLQFEALKDYLNLLGEVIQRLSFQNQSSPDSDNDPVNMTILNEEKILNFRFNLDFFKVKESLTTSPENINSLTGYFFFILGINSFEIPLLDALASGAGFRVSVCPETRIINLKVPLLDK